MLEIDGAIGGGQILRTVVGLSALTLTPFKIVNIRRNRPQPGLRPQHLVGVEIAGQMCNGEIKGARVGSTVIEFIPKTRNLSDKDINIGTAGSIPLLLQTLTSVLVFSDKPITLKIKGGTAGRGAPTSEYIKFVTFQTLRNFGINVPEMTILRQGFYPRGGGVIKVKYFPTKQLNSVKIIERGKIKKIQGFSIAGRLPASVAERQSKGAEKVLAEEGFKCDIKWSNVQTNSSGTSITIFAECENSVLGADGIGEIGKRAESVGEETAMRLIFAINSNKAFDRYASDQIIPFMALAKGTSEITVEEITDHVRTNILVTEKILDVKFDINEKEKKITVDGIGYKA